MIYAGGGSIKDAVGSITLLGRAQGSDTESTPEGRKDSRRGSVDKSNGIIISAETDMQRAFFTIMLTNMHNILSFINNADFAL